MRPALTALLVVACATSACSSGVGTDVTPPTTAPCSPGNSPTTLAPLSRHVVPLDGSTDQTVGLPANIPLPALVHARHDGPDSFVVRGVDASGRDTRVLASALGKYDGTFAVGFVDACAAPTIALHVATSSKWHLDVFDSRLAHRYDDTTGIAGKGDNVLLYLGKSKSVRVTYLGTTRFDVTTYGTGGPGLLAHSDGRSQRTVSLPAGPVFIVVTAPGAWTIGPA